MEDRYEIREKVGQGGIGRVHRGYDHKMQREVAIKRILTSMDDPSLAGEATKQLMVEVEALAKLQHPHIITVFDVGHDEDGPYVVMELINGKSLDEIIEAGPMTWQDFKEVAIQSQEGLLAAQELGMIHSDLKPPNIMLSYLPSGNFQVKILDFGLAVLIHNQSKEEIKKMDTVFGSIFFMPPEQFERQPLDVRSDLYSIGCVYYQALTGTYPFNGTTSDEVMDSHLYHKVTQIHELRRDIPEWACDWVMWLINHNRDDRPQSAREALSNFLQNDENARLAASLSAQKPEAPEPAADPSPAMPAIAGSLTAMTDTAAQTSRPAGTGPLGDLLSRLPVVMIRRIAMAAAAIAVISILAVMVSKRNERVRRGWAYDNIISLAAEKNVVEIPMNAGELQIVLERIAASPANAVITKPLRALELAKSTDGTNIDTFVAKFATTAEMPGDIREKLFKEVIELRHSPSAIPIIKAYAKKTGKGHDTLARLEQLNGVHSAPTKVPTQAPVKVAANPSPKPNPAPAPNNSKPNGQPSPEMKAIMAKLEGGDEARKIEAIAALGQSKDDSAHLKLLGLLKEEQNQKLRSQIIAASIAFNSKPLRATDENRARGRWLQLGWQSQTDEEKQAVTLALKDIQEEWATVLLGEFARNKKHPIAASLASEILEDRKQ